MSASEMSERWGASLFGSNEPLTLMEPATVLTFTVGIDFKKK